MGNPNRLLYVFRQIHVEVIEWFLVLAQARFSPVFYIDNVPLSVLHIVLPGNILRSIDMVLRPVHTLDSESGLQ